MKVAIYGSGAVGGYFGARLLKAGIDVSVVARGGHLKAIQEHGIHICGVSGDFVVQPSIATEDPRDIGKVDLVIVAVKTWQIPLILNGLKQLVGKESIVLPLQNGIETPAKLAEALGKEAVLIGLCQISAQISAPGIIQHVGIEPYLAFGEFDNQPTARLIQLRQLFESAGLHVEIPSDIHAALWDKFLFIASVGALAAVTRAPLGVIREIPQTRTLLEQLMHEIYQVACANGINLSEAVISRRMDFIDRSPYETMPSMARDVMDGKPSELDALIGAVLRFGGAKNVATPLSRALYACLLPQEKLARQKQNIPF